MVLLKSTLTLLSLIFFIGCNENPILDSVSYTIEPNIETVKIQLNFSKDINTDLGGSFALKDYGTLEIDPTTADAPFSIGFRLKTSIFNDQDYARFTPTTVLPTGDPIPVATNRAFAEIRASNSVSPLFDVYGYADVVGKEWLGVAVLLHFIDNQNFPTNLTVSKSFLEDSSGTPRAVGAVFGPSVDGQGHLVKPGGLALFANVRALITGQHQRMLNEMNILAATPVAPKYSGTDSGSGTFKISGKRAAYYKRHPEKLKELQERFVELMNNH